jgi:hypothetical protein
VKKSAVRAFTATSFTEMYAKKTGVFFKQVSLCISFFNKFILKKEG